MMLLMKTALVICDLQPYFTGQLGYIDQFGVKDGREQALINAACAQVRWAMKRRLPIIVLEYANLEYDGDGYFATRTHDDIRCELGSYQRVWYALKDTDAGHEEVLDVMRGQEPRQGLKNGFYRQRNPLRKMMKANEKMTFRICGVNLIACVKETIDGLLEEGHSIEIAANATRDCEGDMTAYHARCWDSCAVKVVGKVGKKFYQKEA
jgi:nicotinamidase-related amidase